MSIQNNSGSVPSQSELEGWASQYGMESVPAVAHDGWEFEVDGYIVTYYILGPGMEVLEADGSGNIGAYL